MYRCFLMTLHCFKVLYKLILIDLYVLSVKAFKTFTFKPGFFCWMDGCLCACNLLGRWANQCYYQCVCELVWEVIRCVSPNPLGIISDLISFPSTFPIVLECLLVHQEIVSVLSSFRSLQARRYLVCGFGSPRTDFITLELA